MSLRQLPVFFCGGPVLTEFFPSYAAKFLFKPRVSDFTEIRLERAGTDSCGQTERQADMTKPIGSFWDYSNAPREKQIAQQ